VYRVRGTIIKDFGADEKTAREECEINNLVAREFDIYPQCFVKSVGKKHYMVTSEVKGADLYKPIMTLDIRQKFQLANLQRYLRKKGYVMFDLRKDNIIIKKKDVVVIDFGNTHQLGDKENLETQYNLNIHQYLASGMTEQKMYMTRSLRQLGIA